jgi:hypothetical protein
MKNKYISFSLWGVSPIYNIGILRNIALAKEIYYDWIVIVYYDNSVPLQTIESLKMENVITLEIKDKIYGMFWRFFAADIPDCEYVIFRDADSRLSLREKYAVDEWINSGKLIHVMRDHPYHEIPFGTNKLSILGGMWGIKGNIISLSILINKYNHKRNLNYGSDQTFLADIYSMFIDSTFTHDEFFSTKYYPIKRDGYRFIGERIDENDVPIGKDWEIIREHYKLKNRFIRFIRKSKLVLKNRLFFYE